MVSCSWIKSLYLEMFVCFFPYRKLKNAIDPNLIVIDTNPLLNTEIDNIRKEFQRLVNNLKRKLIGDPPGFVEGTNIFIFVIFLHNLAENAEEEFVEGARLAVN